MWIGITFRTPPYSSFNLLGLTELYISVARLKGFEHDLHLQGAQFATLLSVLYVGYTIMQVPSLVHSLI